MSMMIDALSWMNDMYNPEDNRKMVFEKMKDLHNIYLIILKKIDFLYLNNMITC